MRPNSQRAQNAIKALIAVMIGIVILTAAAYMLLYTLSNMVYDFNDIESAQSQILSYSLVLGLIGLVQLGIYITCIVLFIMWFRRAYFNLHKLVPSSRLKYTEGWAAGAWFIPIFSLFGPYQIANDLFTESERILVEKGLMDRQPKFHQVKGWWWGLWIASQVFERVSNNVDEGPDFGIAVIVGIISLGLSIGAGMLAIQMIRNYSQMEELLKTIDLDGNIGAPQITNDDLLDSGI
jgi:hypothetical protein